MQGSNLTCNRQSRNAGLLLTASPTSLSFPVNSTECKQVSAYGTGQTRRTAAGLVVEKANTLPWKPDVASIRDALSKGGLGLLLDGVNRHKSQDLIVPDNLRLLLQPCSQEVNHTKTLFECLHVNSVSATGTAARAAWEGLRSMPNRIPSLLPSDRVATVPSAA